MAACSQTMRTCIPMNEGSLSIISALSLYDENQTLLEAMDSKTKTPLKHWNYEKCWPLSLQMSARHTVMLYSADSAKWPWIGLKESSVKTFTVDQMPVIGPPNCLQSIITFHCQKRTPGFRTNQTDQLLSFWWPTSAAITSTTASSVSTTTTTTVIAASLTTITLVVIPLLVFSLILMEFSLLIPSATLLSGFPVIIVVIVVVTASLIMTPSVVVISTTAASSVAPVSTSVISTPSYIWLSEGLCVHLPFFSPIRSDWFAGNTTNQLNNTSTVYWDVSVLYVWTTDLHWMADNTCFGVWLTHFDE